MAAKRQLGDVVHGLSELHLQASALLFYLPMEECPDGEDFQTVLDNNASLEGIAVPFWLLDDAIVSAIELEPPSPATFAWIKSGNRVFTPEEILAIYRWRWPPSKHTRNLEVDAPACEGLRSAT